MSGRADSTDDESSLVPRRVELPGGELRLLQPADAAELPDTGPAKWAPMVPYWSVLWRSGLALGRELAGESLAGRRVVELGCGLGVPSLVAARAGADVLATDWSGEALKLLKRNASENGIELATKRVDWDAADKLVDEGPFDLVLAADVLYQLPKIYQLLALLPRLGAEVWLADPGRSMAQSFLDRAPRRWSVETSDGDEVVEIYRLRRRSDEP
jgi:predicted nicotinamide N-methyase